MNHICPYLWLSHLIIFRFPHHTLLFYFDKIPNILIPALIKINVPVCSFLLKIQLQRLFYGLIFVCRINQLTLQDLVLHSQLLTPARFPSVDFLDFSGILRVNHLPLD